MTFTMLLVTIFCVAISFIFCCKSDASLQLLRAFSQTWVYSKSLRLPTNLIGHGDMTIGHMTSHLTADCFNMMMFTFLFHFVWALPVQVTMATRD